MRRIRALLLGVAVAVMMLVLEASPVLALAPVQVLTLSPDSATKPVGSTHTVTATLTALGSPVSGQAVAFSITSGPDAGKTSTCPATNASGQCTFTFTNTGGPGTDTISGTSGLASDAATATFVQSTSGGGSHHHRHHHHGGHHKHKGGGGVSNRVHNG